MKKYGKTEEELKAEKSLKCREIVSEIIRFGVGEDQKLQIIKLLSLELESNSDMKKIVNIVNEIVENTNSNDDTRLLGVK